MRRATLGFVFLLAACSSTSSTTKPPITSSTSTASTTSAPHVVKQPGGRVTDIYAADHAGRLSPVVRGDRSLVYVPNSKSDTVDVIDPSTDKIVEHFAVGRLPQHVVPAWDLKTLYVTNDQGNTLTPIDPRTGKPGALIPVEDPYNMYFTPDGKYAIVVAERLARLDFRDPHTFKLVQSIPVGCRGVDHMDFSADNTYLIASCEFSGDMIKVDLRTKTVVGRLHLPGASKPQDVKLDPAGRVFYVADLIHAGVFLLDGVTMRVIGFVHTGAGAHGLYVSRDSKVLYVTNRGEGTISLIDFVTRRVVKTWNVGGSPDMGGVSADGNILWVSSRGTGQLLKIDTRSGRLLDSIRVGAQPHGVCVFPQPGRYSLGHTGIYR
ncbi:MAG TPA: YncE family protein [Acidimicrobiia bacterium]|nr:YncE family protein [Acidimicrobiia bacterium]